MSDDKIVEIFLFLKTNPHKFYESNCDRNILSVVKDIINL